MLPVYSSAVSGMQASQQVLDVTANNIANANTYGFDAAQPTVEDLVYMGIDPRELVQTNGPLDTAIGVGARLQGTSHAQSPGNPVVTGNPLDCAITGDGYFQVQQPDGSTGYTRLGSIRVDGQGRFAINGQLLQPPITVPSGAQDISISLLGQVTAKTPSGPQTIGQIQLARFTNPQGLTAIGDTVFAATNASGAPIVGQPLQQGFGGVQPGTLEAPRVDLGKEMAMMILSERAFELNAHNLQTVDTMLSQAVNRQ